MTCSAGRPSSSPERYHPLSVCGFPRQLPAKYFWLLAVIVGSFAVIVSEYSELIDVVSVVVIVAVVVVVVVVAVAVVGGGVVVTVVVVVVGGGGGCWLLVIRCWLWW